MNNELQTPPGNVYSISVHTDYEATAVGELSAPLKHGGGGGTSGGMSDDWKTGVETQLAQLHGDVRHLLIGLIAGFLMLAGAGWTVYLKLSDQLTAVQVEMAKSGVKLESIDDKLDTLIDGQQPSKSGK